MSIEALERRFAAVGARVKVAGGLCRGEPRINIRSDARGEYFELWFAGRGQAVELEVVDVHPRDRHLLLLARIGLEKSKFLCGHDERHWFVAAVPETARGVRGVEAAKAALQPEVVRRAPAPFRDRLTGRTPRSERGDRGSVHAASPHDPGHRPRDA
jgi:hypothetical protein